MSYSVSLDDVRHLKANWLGLYYVLSTKPYGNGVATPRVIFLVLPYLSLCLVASK